MVDEQQERKLPDRLPNEPNKWYDRFAIFTLLGPSRSVYAAYMEWRIKTGKLARENAQKRGGLPKSWLEAASKWNWANRAEAFDEDERRNELTAWAKRREELRQQEWKFSQELLDKARQMLVFPLAKTTRSQAADGQTILTEVYPTRWSSGDVARYLEAASKLARLALGEATEHISHEIDVSSDDLAQARQKALEWEKQVYGDD